MSYIYPTSVTTVTPPPSPNPAGGSFQGHKNRTPKSPNPGSDYPCKSGTPVYAVANGRVTALLSKLAQTGGAGRYVHMDHDDGNGSDYLHLSSIVAVLGEIWQGQLIGYSGGSGYGEENYYDPHLHISIRNRHGYPLQDAGNFDFDAMMKSGTAGGGGTPIIELLGDDDMKAIRATNGSIAITDGFYFGEYGGSDVVGQSAAKQAWGNPASPTGYWDVGNDEYVRLKADAPARAAARDRATAAAVVAAGGSGGGGAPVDYSKIATPTQVAAVGTKVDGVAAQVAALPAPPTKATINTVPGVASLS